MILCGELVEDHRFIIRIVFVRSTQSRFTIKYGLNINDFLKDK